MRVEGPAGGGGVQWASTMQHAVDKTEGRLLSLPGHTLHKLLNETRPFVTSLSTTPATTGRWGAIRSKGFLSIDV